MKILRTFVILLLAILLLIWICEYCLYYVILLRCKWPVDDDKTTEVRAMILADPHMLGPRRGHWLDKWRREWQMHRTFQTSMTMFQPDVVFILGDVFDEGTYVDHTEFQEYVQRFNRLFYTPRNTMMVAVVGNHDIGFHYRTHPYFVYRFDKAFNTSGINLITIKNIHFVTINSIAMEGDGCEICNEAEEKLNQISKFLHKRMETYSQPIILQHFPTYRKSDDTCIQHDSPKMEVYREKWEVLSKRSTKLLGEKLKPRVAFSGHTHNYCHIINSLNIDEYTISSFSWRNKKNPSFLLVNFGVNRYNVEKCDMPQEVTIMIWYFIGAVIIAYGCVKFNRRSKDKQYKLI